LRRYSKLSKSELSPTGKKKIFAVTVGQPTLAQRPARQIPYDYVALLVIPAR
jgi:hypothetical protein